MVLPKKEEDKRPPLALSWPTWLVREIDEAREPSGESRSTYTEKVMAEHIKTLKADTKDAVLKRRAELAEAIRKASEEDATLVEKLKVLNVAEENLHQYDGLRSTPEYDRAMMDVAAEYAARQKMRGLDALSDEIKKKYAEPMSKKFNVPIELVIEDAVAASDPRSPTKRLDEMKSLVQLKMTLLAKYG